MLHVHRAERADRLAESLAAILREPLADPFAAEVVAVSSRGVERWLAQRLAHRLGASEGADGVCAHVDFPSPARLVGRVLDGGDPEASAVWEPERLVWPLLEVVDASVGEPWCPALTAYVTGRDGRRYAAARHLAGLFAAYGEHRPAMVRGWRDKDDSPEVPGLPAVPEDLRWQAELWRRLRERIGRPSPAETLVDVTAALRADPAAVALPPRLSLFGPTRLSTTGLEVLAALAAHRDVHLWLPHASPAMWDAGPDEDAVTHPLLRSLAREVRELAQRLGALDTPVTAHHHGGDAPAARTRLALLQDDLRHDRAPTPLEPRPESDGSIQVHACHGPARQVEVLREVILGLLAADPTLEPRDVMVLCPDIETYAPLITANFGLTVDTGDGATRTEHPGHRLAVRLADRSLRQVNPLLGTVATLLELADARVTASALLDLAESAPVRRRFRFDDDDLDRLRDLTARAGVRWGLDAEHRRPFGLHRYPQNSWSAGLDRLLLGAAMSEDEHRWLDTALPLDDVDSDVIDLVGRMSELVDRVAAVLDRLSGTGPLRGWTDALAEGLDTLTAVAPADAWQLSQARAELAEVADAGADACVDLADVRGVLSARLQGRPTRTNFRTGTLTVATLVPMRAVPHRVICLLGLDDGVFPREHAEDGDDVLVRAPRPGEPDPRVEDRQLFLDAIGAATEHLVIVHSGADERTNAPRPPAVPLGELLDVVGRDVVTTHPLQPFDARNFDPAAPFSFDTAALAGARRVVGERHAPRPFLDAALDLPADAEDTTALDDLVRFVEHPVKAFLVQRLGIYPRNREEEPDDALPVELDGLSAWQIGDRLLTDRLTGAEPEACRQAEWRRGALPPGTLGRALLEEMERKVEPLVAASARLREMPARTLDVDAVGVAGTVPGVRGTTLLTVTYSKLAAKQRLRAWVQLLALTVNDPDGDWTACTLGRGRGGVARSTLGPVDPEVAARALADLVALRREGLCEPLPLITKTSCLYAEARRRGCEDDDARARAADEWAGKFPERDDAAYRQVWGSLAFDGLPADRFRALAGRLWIPLLDAERKDTP